MRSFIAIGISTPEVLKLLDELRNSSADLKIVKPENLHLTLKFLGDIPEGRTEEIQIAVTKAIAPFKAFDVSLRGVGVFPKIKRMRVIWVGFDKNGERFVEINNSIENSLKRIGFQREGRFHPHLTVARVRSQRGKENLISILRKYEDTSFGESRIESVELMKSILTPRGPIYSVVEQVKLTD